LASDLITCNSSHTAKEVNRICGRSSEIIPYGTTVSTKEVTASIKERPVVLFVGRLIQRKGVEFLIRSVPAILKKKDIEVIIVGDGDCRNELQKLSRELDLEKNVSFRGTVSNEELSRLYGLCDIFVLPAVHDDRGDTEGLGVVLVEALMYRRAVIASNVGGIIDVIKHEQTGLLVPERDANSLAEAIMRLINDPPLADRLGSQGLEFAKTYFNWELITDKLESSLLGIAGKYFFLKKS